MPARLLAALVLSLALAPSAAAEEHEFGRPGPYLYAGGTLGHPNFQGPLGQLTVSDTGGLNARLGYRFAAHVAVEGDVDWLAGFDFTDVSNLEAEVYLVTANLKTYPLFGRFQPFLLVGVGAAHVNIKGLLESRETDFIARFGAGIEFYLFRHLALSADAGYVLPTGDLKNFDIITGRAGILFRY
jgi:opacity protein-like surface antigen